MSIQFGIDTLLAKPPVWKTKRIAFLTNDAATTNKGVSSRKALTEAGFNLVLLFSPEHGISTKGEDGLKIKNQVDSITQLPIISLYNEKLMPSKEDLTGIEILVFDIPDAGTRFYTYLWTMSYFIETAAKINIPIIKGYINQMKTVIPDADETELMKMAVRMPDALKTERDDIDEEEWESIQKVIDEATHNIVKFRKHEGVDLEKEFLHRIANIMSLMDKALSYDKERVETIKKRLKTALEELKSNVDENRFEQELIFYLEKYDITEEKVRLENHLNYFIETLAGTEANGRKLGFITQEMGREINTMGSKSNHAEMQKIVVMMKDELEKIKEQVLNVL